ncbi:hypothetical protein Esi_0085_0093 [Ectocarpus siliculosus]|uniref:Uncharacterized protein n=1 Tax=Ectocarpus siliculosus TaxID=2880 RepID=D7G7U6_ECTSI|nr:hypothetical protein Esi_0085_0093 [Ectocarpus siliculosus]|eukprot:CBJ27827.1 hypothetical protein Esi_0085_0093 [Ectocarpus siliculosus]
MENTNSSQDLSFDVLGVLPTVPTTTPLEPSLIGSHTRTGRPQSHHSYALGGEGIASGTGGSTESGLEQGFERESYDSDQELEAIRGSVRSLRAQRAAVEKLKEKARLQEGTAEELRRKLREAEGKVCELRAQGGRDVVRRLMDEVTELRARLKATSTAFQTRENSVADLREAVQTLTLDLRAGQEKARAQSRKLEQQCAASGRELASLSALLREANATLDASKGSMQATVAKQAEKLEAARKEKESLLFEKGQTQERVKELTSMCERQRSKLADAGHRARELERLASAAKKETRLAQEQAAKLKTELSAADKRRREEDAGATIKLRTAARQVEELRSEVVLVKSEAAEKARQLVRHRDEMSAFREDVSKLREAAVQQGDMRQAVRDRDETIRDLRRQLELERRERGQWGQARKQLLLEFCEEENKLRSTLQPAQHQEPRSTRRQGRKQAILEHAPPTGSDRRLTRHKPLSRHATIRNIRTNGDSRRSSANSSLRGEACVAREEEKVFGDSEAGEVLLDLAGGGVRDGGTGTLGGYEEGNSSRTMASDEFEMRPGQQLSQQA